MSPLPSHNTPLHLIDALSRAASNQSGGVIIAGGKDGTTELERATWTEIQERSVAVAARLRAEGIDSSSNVVLLLPTGLDFVVSFFALQILGATPVPAPPPAGLRWRAVLDRVAAIAQSCRCREIITSRKLRTIVGELAHHAPELSKVLEVESIEAEGSGTELRPVWINPSSTAFLQYTSGSTRDPRGVIVTHANLMANCDAIAGGLQWRAGDVYAGWCPLFHDMGLIGQVLVPMHCGAWTVLMSPADFLSRPIRWLRMMHHFGATISTAPNFAYGMAASRTKAAEREGLDLSRWRAALVGAEMVQVRTIESFTSTFAANGFRESSILPVYGLAEATLGVTFPSLSSGMKFERIDRQLLRNGIARRNADGIPYVSVGRPIAGVEIKVVDESGHALGERQVGEVLVRGTSVTEGYYRDLKRTRSVFRRDWLRTGDLGYVAGGDLYVTGRAKDLIIMRGANFYPEDIESAAERVRGIRRGNVVAFPKASGQTDTEGVVVAAETRLSSDAHEALAAEIREAIADRTGLAVEEVLLLRPGTLPKTSSGKRQRRLTRYLHECGELHPPTESPLSVIRLRWRSMVGRLQLAQRGRRATTATLQTTEVTGQ